MPEIESIEGILIVGGGYAGLHAARAAADGGAPVTIVDAEGVHGFTTRLAAVAGGTAPSGDAFAPLEAFGHRVRVGRVVTIEDGRVELDDGATLVADAVIVTAGARPVAPDMPGLHLAWPLRSPGHAIGLARHLAEVDRVSIVGGGATGVQLAGSLAGERPDMTIRIIDRTSSLLDGLGEPLGRHAEQILDDRGVELLLGEELEEVTDGGLRLDSGRDIDGPVVWAGGFESVVDDLGPDLPTVDGRLQVSADLLVTGHQRTFAAGDVAAHADRDGETLPMAAQIAVQAGAIAGSNAAALITGGEMTTARLHHRGWVIDLGGGQGVATLGPVSLAAVGLDRLPPLLHHLIDLKHLVEIGGLNALRFAPGRHRPSGAAVDRLATGATVGVEA